MTNKNALRRSTKKKPARTEIDKHDLSTTHRARIARATVTVEGHAQGVLVAGGLVLTAAHCLEWHGTGMMALAPEEHGASVTTTSGAKFWLQAYAVEPVSDIAVLGKPDEQERFDDAQAFREWHEATEPVAVRVNALAPGETLGVHAFAHTRKWIPATTARSLAADPSGRAGCTFASRIEGGTSGGPVVDDDGRLVSIVSNCAEADHGPWFGMVPVVCGALPCWIWSQIERAQK